MSTPHTFPVINPLMSLFITSYFQVENQENISFLKLKKRSQLDKIYVNYIDTYTCEQWLES